MAAIVGSADRLSSMDTGTTVVYSGRIVERSYGEDDDAVFVGEESNEPFAARFRDDLDQHGRYVSVSYYVSQEPKTADELLENELRKVAGSAEADYTQRYSDITGYLWTDEELNVGGHDLLDELYTLAGQYLYMTVTFAEEDR